MFFAKQKSVSALSASVTTEERLTSRIGSSAWTKLLPPNLSNVASDFYWAYRTVFPSAEVSYQRQSRFLLRTIWNLQSSAVWFNYLKTSYLCEFVASEPSLVEAVHRPFFDRTISAAQRVRLLTSHFQEFHSLFGSHQAIDLMIGDRLALCQIEGKNAEQFDITLIREDAYKREGGVTLELSMNKLPLLCLTFALQRRGSDIVIKVGGIQSKGLHCRNAARDATHALHGIQPRLLLIDALRAIASKVHCTNIECISKENHIHRSWRYRLKKTIHAEYNQLWLLAGGKENARGNFDLPIVIEEKSLEERPSKKRSEYRRRAVLLDAMRQQITHQMSHPERYPNLLWESRHQNLSLVTSVVDASNDRDSYNQPTDILSHAC